MPDPERVTQALRRLREKGAVTKYLRLQSQVRETNVARDFDFQRSFNGYYKVRYRSQEWRRTFYEIFEASKAGSPGVGFRAVLANLHRRTTNYEASFSSKLVASLDPSAPVWDSRLMAYWGLRAPNQQHKARLEAFVEVYEMLRNLMAGLLASSGGQTIIAQFDKEFSSEAKHVSDMKKADLVLWQIA